MKWLACSIALALAACGPKSSSTTTQTTPTGTTAPKTDDDPSCPLVVPGTSLSVEDTEAGAALVFVTTGDPLAVRARAAALAEMHTKHDGPPSALGMMFTQGSIATAMEIEGGARVEFAAATPNQVAPLQKELRMHAGHLTTGSCEM
jgi:hypothetical protein